ncbi:NIPSNAP family protein [Paraburkholderia bannensis]|uniref:NIPSNAP family protein n=1 Tax=Paraburkholderia bannensis TaxID=765414 RepID=UPI002AC33759|nr:NIPSNAP family protein [Paraburkholderia bannensis]
MIYELREYTLDVENAPAYFELFREVGMPIRGDDYGRLVGNWTVDGEYVKFIHIWEYASLQDRAQKRQALGQVDAWTRTFLPEAARRVSSQFLSILNPAGGRIRSKPAIHTPELDGRVLHTLRCRLGAATRVAAAIEEGSVARYDGIWIGEFPDPNTIYVLGDESSVPAKDGELDDLGVIYASSRKISAGPYR